VLSHPKCRDIRNARPTSVRTGHVAYVQILRTDHLEVLVDDRGALDRAVVSRTPRHAQRADGVMDRARAEPFSFSQFSVNRLHGCPVILKVRKDLIGDRVQVIPDTTDVLLPKLSYGRSWM
jgi:hypothetical protein